MTSNAPPAVSPASRQRSISAIMFTSASRSAQRSAESEPMSRAASNVTRSGESSPMPLTRYTWLTISTSNRPKQLPGNRACRDTRRGLARARALEHVANVGAVVLDDARKVGMPRTWPRDDRPDRAGRSGRRLVLGMHRLLPVFPILVANEQRDGRAKRFAGAHTGENLGLVGFDRHAAAAAVPTLTPLELFGDGLEIDMQSGRHAFENDDESLAVRLAGGEKTQHCLAILYEVSALFRRRPAQSRPVFAGEPIAEMRASHGHADC